MSQQDPALGSLSSGQLLGDSGSGPTPPPRRAWLPVLVIALVAAVALAMVAGAAVLLLSGDDSSSDEPAVTATTPGTEDHSDERDVQPAPETPAEPEQPAPEAPARPAEQPSLLAPAGVRGALRRIRAEAGGRKALTLRIDRRSVTAVVKGKLILFRDGKLQALPGPPEAPNGFRLDGVDDTAPSRIEKGLRRKGKRLDYVAFVRNPITGERSWAAFPVGGGSGYGADESGRGLCELGARC